MYRRPNTPTKFTTSDLASINDGVIKTTTFKGSDNIDSNYLFSSSFNYDSYGSGLKSTQQLKVDWSDFKNHTFFNSAQAKVNIAFDTIINKYPFDGSKKDLEKFVDNLTGYEKYVFDQFPKNVGYLNFSQSYLRVNDYQGSLIPDLAKKKSGDSILDVNQSSYTIESYLYICSENNAHTQSILQKKHSTENVGYCLFAKPGASSDEGELVWTLFSGSYNLVTSCSFQYDNFFHVAALYDYDNTSKISLYLNGDLKNSSNNSFNFSKLDTNRAVLQIGSGSSFVSEETHTPTSIFSGSIDELRIYNLLRNQQQIKTYMSKNIFSQDNLLLYYKFNEPTGSLTGDEISQTNSIVLDSSGNGLHSYITNFNFNLRSTGSINTPLSNERLDTNPIIFPGYSDVQNFNTLLLYSGSLYDQDNPNLITKLVPKHFLSEGKDFQGLTSEEGNIGNSYEGESIPGSGILGSTQLFLSLLYSWAKYFDELKLFVDAFSKIHYVDYNEEETSPDIFLPLALKEFGIKMPNLFSDSTFSQYKDGENIDFSYSLSENSLYSIQNQIMRRVLTNMGEIVRSKGTLHSIETFFRSVGIDPNNSFKIKERGGATRRDLNSLREQRVEPVYFLDFGRGGNIKSSYLSGSRTEIGVPEIDGTFVNKEIYSPHGISNNSSDGLFTSGSWAFEALYRFPLSGSYAMSQSLCRLYTTGSNNETLIANLVAHSGSNSNVSVYIRPGSATSLNDAPIFSMSLDVNIFNGDPWYINFGRWRNDHTGSIVSSSYYLRAGNNKLGNSNYFIHSESLFQEIKSSGADLFSNISTSLNASGVFTTIGNSTSVQDTTFGLNKTGSIDNAARTVNFNGQVSYIKFWSKALEYAESLEHSKNPNSAGVINPHINYNFSNNITGSFEKLRNDITVQQSNELISDINGNITLFDYSQNNLSYVGSNFPSSLKIIKPWIIGYSYLSPNIDEAVTSEKVRVRSYRDFNNVKNNSWAQSTPVYEVRKSEEPQDDPRVSIEFSLVDALNRDIITMFSTYDEIDNALGAPENDFSSTYTDLEHLKQIYFNRLTNKLNFSAFFDFYRWFDNSISYFVQNLIPRKSIYYGTNYVIESHLLERHKKQYHHYDMYLRESEKPLIEDRVLLQQIAGSAKKY